MERDQLNVLFNQGIFYGVICIMSRVIWRRRTRTVEKKPLGSKGKCHWSYVMGSVASRDDIFCRWWGLFNRMHYFKVCIPSAFLYILKASAPWPRLTWNTLVFFTHNTPLQIANPDDINCVPIQRQRLSKAVFEDRLRLCSCDKGCPNSKAPSNASFICRAMKDITDGSFVAQAIWRFIVHWWWQDFLRENARVHC